MSDLMLDDGLRLHYQLDGDAETPALVFSNSLGADLRMWDEQVAMLSSRFRIVRYDTRGHGQSDVSNEPVFIERLGRDLLALLDHLGIERAHVCGLSLGGLTAIWLAAHHPGRVARLILANTAARIGSTESWEARIAAVQTGGMGAIREMALARFFSPAFHSERPEIVQRYGAMLDSIDPSGYIAACAALRDANLRPALSRITAPALVIAGALDEATPPAQAAELHAALANSRLVVLERAAHLSNVEQPEVFAGLIEQYSSKS
jgi:3-oxoadipate enol-lactonase